MGVFDGLKRRPSRLGLQKLLVLDPCSSENVGTQPHERQRKKKKKVTIDLTRGGNSNDMP